MVMQSYRQVWIYDNTFLFGWYYMHVLGAHKTYNSYNSLLGMLHSCSCSVLRSRVYVGFTVGKDPSVYVSYDLFK